MNYHDDGYDSDGKPEPYGGYDAYGGVRTHADYWDCGCDYHYIHAKADTLICKVCGDEEDESPDARVNEVADALGWTPYECKPRSREFIEGLVRNFIVNNRLLAYYGEDDDGLFQVDFVCTEDEVTQ